jgi:hypothetical protein
MLRLILALLLVSASAHALALNNRAVTVVPSCEATEAMGREEPAQAGVITPKASAVHNKSAKPALNPGHGGGGNDDDNQPRLRGSKWHSFLPGMFR